MESLFNDGWEFQLNGEGAWRPVEIPHDWLINDVRNLYATGVGRYRKVVDAFDMKSYQKYWLRFDGVYMDSTLYINGKRVGEWKHGYTAFSHEITPFLRAGENEILLEVNHQSPNSRWYSGAGMYRDCWLVAKKDTYFLQDGMYISTRREGENWRVYVDAEVCTECLADDDLNIETGENSKTNINIAIKYYVQCDESIRVTEARSIACQEYNFSFDFLVENPKLWDIWSAEGFGGTAACYTLVTELWVNGERRDTARTRFGFREISFLPDDGFMLNGRRVKIFGVCQHHDLGGLGAAVSKDALRRQLDILREMGVNAIRTAHNPPAAVFMELADEMGFLVQSEFTDMWKRQKTKYDYARFFDEWAARDVASWVRRDRNCPSLIMWSLGNEIPDTHADFADGSATMRFLMEEVARHDPRRNASPTLCSNYMAWENTQKCADIIKLIGYNYAEYLYCGHHTAHPDWVIYGAETASTVQSRGVYHFPLAKPILCDDDMQCSALGNSTTSWGAKNPEACIIDHRDATFSLGQFIWTGFDYLGEPTPYRTKNSYFGQVDTAGFPKDSYYIYQSAWVPFDVRPTLHLFPHWDWNEGQLIDVRIASNAPRVELFVNGKSQGVREIDHAKGVKRNTGTATVYITADYIIPYEPGEIKAVAYDASGAIVMEAVRRSFGDTAALRMKHNTYGALTFTEITAVDTRGNPVENANTRVRVTAIRGKLLALDNGDSTDYDAYTPLAGDRTLSRRMFNGKLLAITKDTGGGVDITTEINPSYIPVRKIEIKRGGNGGGINGSVASDKYIIEAKIHPPNASDDTLHWRLTDVAGIDTPLANIVPSFTSNLPESSNSNNAPHSTNNRTIRITPRGDGEIYIRCAANNGKNHADIISTLPISLTGFGKPFLDPYNFVCAGLYNRSNNAEIGNGNERGIATARSGESHLGFADLDFGAYGSDTLTIWIFAPEPSPFDFDIYLGMPGENGRLLYTAHYNKGSIWDKYQEQTYKLPEPLTGVQTLCFIFRRALHVKGFQFAPPQRAFTRIPFAAYDHIYGDSYVVKESTVEQIGNNVSITFTNMDFDPINKSKGADIDFDPTNEKKEAGEIEIAWRATRSNTVRITFTPRLNENNAAPTETVNQLTLPAQANYTPVRLKLDTPLRGRGTLNFIFLPGTKIDIAWFHLHP